MLSYLVTKRGQTGGTTQDQCSTSFLAWYIFLCRARLQLETVCAWVIFHCLLTHLMHLVLQCRDRMSRMTEPSIVHGDPFEKFACQYARQRVIAALSRPTLCFPCVKVRGNKHALLLHWYGTRRLYNWNTSVGDVHWCHLITSPSPLPCGIRNHLAQLLWLAGTAIQKEYIWVSWKKLYSIF